MHSRLLERLRDELTGFLDDIRGISLTAKPENRFCKREWWCYLTTTYW